LQILGIGSTGHIGFNEPGSTRHSRTRRVTLDPLTRRVAAAGFFGEENVPNQAITMGVSTILSAKKIVLLAFGEHKAAIVQKTLENPPTDIITASFLQDHRDSTVILDEAAAAELSAVRRPWEIGPIKWTDDRIRQATIWLARRVNKALLKLNDEDFRDNNLYELLREYGPAESLGNRVFQDRMATICTH